MASLEEGTNRTNIRVRGQEMVASGEITQEQLDESLRIFEKTKSMDAVNEYMRSLKKAVTDKDATI